MPPTTHAAPRAIALPGDLTGARVLFWTGVLCLAAWTVAHLVTPAYDLIDGIRLYEFEHGRAGSSWHSLAGDNTVIGTALADLLTTPLLLVGAIAGAVGIGMRRSRPRALAFVALVVLAVVAAWWHSQAGTPRLILDPARTLAAAIAPAILQALLVVLPPLLCWWLGCRGRATD